MHGESPIGIGVRGIKKKIYEVKSTQKSRGKVDVVDNREAGVVSGRDGVSGGKDGGACVELRNDAGFRNRHGLLLHYFLQVGGGRRWGRCGYATDLI